MFDLSATVIEYVPAFIVITFLPSFFSVIVKPGPTVPGQLRQRRLRGRGDRQHARQGGEQDGDAKAVQSASFGMRARALPG